MNANAPWLVVSMLLLSSVAQGDETAPAIENGKAIRAAMDQVTNATDQLQALQKRRKEAGTTLGKSETTELDKLLSKIRELQAAAVELKEESANRVLIRVRVLEVQGKALAELETVLPNPTFTSEAKMLSIGETEALMDRLKKTGGLTILAEPVLVTTIGRPASMLSGGEFPVPTPARNGETDTEWRRFGVRLQACPTLGNRPDELQLDIQAEVSERDFKNVTTGKDGSTIPGLRTAGMNTHVVLPYGKTAVLGGLRSTENPRGDAAANIGTDSGEKMAVFLVSLEKFSLPAE